jgi:hypothetical protein
MIVVGELPSGGSCPAPEILYSKWQGFGVGGSGRRASRGHRPGGLCHGFRLSKNMRALRALGRPGGLPYGLGDEFAFFEVVDASGELGSVRIVRYHHDRFAVVAV